MEILKKKFLLS